MYKRLTDIFNSRFFRNVVIVASGTAGAQIITIAFTPVITRLYGPEAFGLLGTFIAILAITTPIAALTYPTAIVLPKTDNEAYAVVRLSFMISIFIASLSFFFFLVLGLPLAKFLNIENISNFLILIPVAMLFSAFYEILQQWLIRKKEYKITAKVAVVQSLALNSSKTYLGWFNPIGSVLIFVTVIGNVFYAMLLLLEIMRNSVPFGDSSKDVAKLNLKDIAKKYIDFPYYRAPQTAINALSQSLPVLMLAGLFGPAAAGFYTLAKTIMDLPSTLISKSVGDVFYPRIAEAAQNREKIYFLTRKATVVLAGLGVIPFSVVIAFGPWLFSIIFGNEWLVAGEYARWLSIWLYTMFVTSACARVMPVIGAQKLDLYFTFYKVFVRIFSIFVASLFLDTPIDVIVFFVILSSLVNIHYMVVVFNKVKRFDLYGSNDSQHTG